MRYSQGEASKLFRISRNTINLWFKRKAETGDIQPKKRDFSNAKQKIGDLEAFRKFAEQHQDRTQAEMAQLWEGTVSSRTISRRLAALNWSRKKRLMGTLNAMKLGELNWAMVRQLIMSMWMNRVWTVEMTMLMGIVPRANGSMG